MISIKLLFAILSIILFFFTENIIRTKSMLYRKKTHYSSNGILGIIEYNKRGEVTREYEKEVSKSVLFSTISVEENLTRSTSYLMNGIEIEKFSQKINAEKLPVICEKFNQGKIEWRKEYKYYSNHLVEKISTFYPILPKAGLNEILFEKLILLSLPNYNGK